MHCADIDGDKLSSCHARAGNLRFLATIIVAVSEAVLKKDDVSILVSQLLIQSVDRILIIC